MWRGTYQNEQWSCSAPNGWGCGYTYGFRVPLLVVSPYTGTWSNNAYGPYVSGACGSGEPNCPNNVFPYGHDFGSILAFTEWNFKMPFIDETGDNGYADYNAPDWSSDHQQHVPLSDFFSLYPTKRQFVSINSTLEPYTFFQTYYKTTGTGAVGPDDDANSD